MTTPKPRFMIDRIPPITRKYTYFVTGKREFPFDMLRYDKAWPVDTDSAMAMEWHGGYAASGEGEGLRSILLQSYREPTIDRWLSFGWSVGLEKL